MSPRAMRLTPSRTSPSASARRVSLRFHGNEFLASATPPMMTLHATRKQPQMPASPATLVTNAPVRPTIAKKPSSE
jgi:hypothetical protein